MERLDSDSSCSFCEDPDRKACSEVTLAFTVPVYDALNLSKYLKESASLIEIFRGFGCVHGIPKEGVSAIVLNLRCSTFELRQCVERLVCLKSVHKKKTDIMRTWIRMFDIFTLGGKNSHSSSPPPL